jgi:hypothetical protein
MDKYIIDRDPFAVYHKHSQFIYRTFSSWTKPERQYEIAIKDITGTTTKSKAKHQRNDYQIAIKLGSTKSKAKHHRNDYQIAIKLGLWNTLDHERRDLGDEMAGISARGSRQRNEQQRQRRRDPSA